MPHLTSQISPFEGNSLQGRIQIRMAQRAPFVCMRVHSCTHVRAWTPV